MSDENTAPVEGAEGAESVATTEPDASVETPVWDGSADTLADQPWYESIPEAARAHIETWGSSAAQLNFYRQIVDADPDQAAIAADRTKLKDMEAQLAEAGKSATELADLRKQIEDEKLNKEFDAWAAEHKTILDSPKAWKTYLALRNGGEPEEDALEAAYALTGKAPAAAAGAPTQATEPAPVVQPRTRTVTLPKSEAAMSSSTNTARSMERSKYAGKTLDEAIALQEAAAREADKNALG